MFLHIEEKKRLADFCAGEKSKLFLTHRETDRCLPAICGGRFLFVCIGLRLPLLRTWQMPFRFFYVYWLGVGHKRNPYGNGKDTAKTVPKLLVKHS